MSNVIEGLVFVVTSIFLAGVSAGFYLGLQAGRAGAKKRPCCG